ncbi:MAG: DNA repair protein RadA [Candidatus Aminicenantes bacterium RBG_13_63_10]|nr:MAG: DNA repair protein RadA [Candidatus Aminicenantes bacterium RBG_13_63_10]
MKTKTVFICQSCGHQSPKWLGRCSSCGEWGSLVEEVEEARPASAAEAAFADTEPTLFRDIKAAERQRLPLRIEEFDKVLGGGVVLGSLVLIGGEPGIGKSTLLLQAARDFAEQGETVLYVSGEESLEQVKLRGDRLGVGEGRLYLLAETNLERVLGQAERVKPRVLILDSVQTVYSSKLTSSPGTISQVREVAHQIFRYAKKNQVSAFLIGHITKEGSLAGPKSLEHMVDVVLLFEGERDHSHRVLRALKNRYGPVSELAVFEMSSEGLRAIGNPSEFFLRERPAEEPGSVVVCALKGSRPLLVEIQALVSDTLFASNPRRMTIGLDHFRASMLLALVEKRMGFGFGGQDIYLNVAGGLTIEEPAADLAVIAAVVSSLKNKAVPADTVVFGEVGLSGEVRSVGQAGLRLKEAAALGFRTVILPKNNAAALAAERPDGIRAAGVDSVRQAMKILFS